MVNKSVCATFVLIVSASLMSANASADANTNTNTKAGPCDALVREDALNACLTNELSRSDKELNVVYGKFRGVLDARDREKLKASQSAWIKSRDSDCGFEVESVSGGSAYQSVYLSCMIDHTQQRTRQLVEWAKQFPSP